MEKQTAVEWHYKATLEIFKQKQNLSDEMFLQNILNAYLQAKEMEKEQLVVFGAECVVQAESGLGTIGIYENYYSKKFK